MTTGAALALMTGGGDVDLQCLGDSHLVRIGGGDADLAQLGLDGGRGVEPQHRLRVRAAHLLSSKVNFADIEARA